MFVGVRGLGVVDGRGHNRGLPCQMRPLFAHTRLYFRHCCFLELIFVKALRATTQGPRRGPGGSGLPESAGPAAASASCRYVVAWLAELARLSAASAGPAGARRARVAGISGPWCGLSVVQVCHRVVGRACATVSCKRGGATTRGPLQP